MPKASSEKRSIRIPSWEARASGVTPIVDQFDLVSKLFSDMGISRAEFEHIFHFCPKCDRVSRLPHTCVIEIDSELEDDLARVIGD